MPFVLDYEWIISHAHEAGSMGIDARGRHQPHSTMLLSMLNIRATRNGERNDSMILIMLRESTVWKRNEMMICWFRVSEVEKNVIVHQSRFSGEGKERNDMTTWWYGCSVVNPAWFSWGIYRSTGTHREIRKYDWIWIAVSQPAVKKYASCHAYSNAGVAGFCWTVVDLLGINSSEDPPMRPGHHQFWFGCEI